VLCCVDTTTATVTAASLSETDTDSSSTASSPDTMTASVQMSTESVVTPGPPNWPVIIGAAGAAAAVAFAVLGVIVGFVAANSRRTAAAAATYDITCC